MVQTFRPDIAIVDIGMPNLNGYEIAQALQANTSLKTIRLIALTGWGQDEHRERALRSGFDHHLTKPVDLARLKAILSAAP